MNSRKSGKSIKSFEFLTLYIKLPHDKLQIMLRRFIDFCFDGRENNFILPNYFGTRWMKEKIKMVSSGLVNKIYKRCCQKTFFPSITLWWTKNLFWLLYSLPTFFTLSWEQVYETSPGKGVDRGWKCFKVSALLMIWMQSMMLKYLKVSSGIYT